MAERTKGPWQIDGSDNQGVLSPAGRFIAGCVGDLSKSECQANAAFIVRAANNHDELVAALRMVSGCDLPHTILAQVDAALSKATS